ncbi:uncharacterized protein LOC128232302 [Mya arenaria]|uniref:uncharacterized protein LOC128232302 n=1 Tax=Mya arenaria TaxID=6604 RepID=UPI0022E6C4EA|nr:uncharacterized protein LOC128232302 [Mya arenaria]
MGTASALSRMLFIVFMLSGLCLAAVLQDGGPSKHVYKSKPTGHCDPVCSCQMDGVYYSEGERWAKPLNPCLVFKCMPDGFFEVVENGCEYKDTCHPVNSTWTDDCNTFTCSTSGTTVQYYLKEAGCQDADGQCLSVGERLVRGCDVIECQLNGGSLKITKIQTGCAVGDSCRPVDSYWHDGCTIHTCNVTNDVAEVKLLPNDAMLWPAGPYAMLKPVSGCPKDVPESWREGTRKHFGDGANVYSDPLSLSGTYVPAHMSHKFCVHGPASDMVAAPKYKTYWERGSYCILRSGGFCPRGFTNGFIKIDDADAMALNATNIGYLPDGEFSPDTGLYFCCRGDGPPSTEIVMPKENSFVLFMKNGATGCQQVQGMNATVEFMTFDGAPTSSHVTEGNLPALDIQDGDVKLSICHYRPLECGCKDESGQYIIVNTQKMINCVLKRCVKQNGANVLEVVSGGCQGEGRCWAESDIWAEFLGESCTRFTCWRRGRGASIHFKVSEISQGCRDGDRCRSIGSQLTRDCYTSTCKVNPETQKPAFKVNAAECPWLESCMPPNSTWELNCITYRCDIQIEADRHQWNVIPITYACEWNGSCYEANQTWSDGCIDYQCDVSRAEREVNWNVKTLKIACKDFSGRCVPVGQTVKDNCIDYMCIQSGRSVGLSPVSVGCQYNELCKYENETWTDNERCAEYQCNKAQRNKGTVMQISVVGYGCVFNSTCKKVNETWADGCRTRKCVVRRTDKMIQRSIAPVTAGCDDQGICRPIGFTKMTNSCAEYECQFNDTYKDAFFTLSGGGCRTSEGGCKVLGAEWTERRQGLCLQYACHKSTIGFVSKMITQSCLDANGVCQPIGSTGFSAVIEDKLQPNCRCEQSTRDLDRLAITCGVP